MGYKNDYKGGQDRERSEARAAKCKHRFAPAIPECFGFDVATDTEYRVQLCSGCDTRRDVTLEGSVFRQYLAVKPLQDPTVTPDGRDVYVPRFNGVDAFNESEDTNDTSALFDARGGSNGVGDVSFPTIED